MEVACLDQHKENINLYFVNSVIVFVKVNVLSILTNSHIQKQNINNWIIKYVCICSYISACNNCDYCRQGLYHYCLTGGVNSSVGVRNDGGWAQYCKVPDYQVFELPENVSLEQGEMSS